MKPNAFPAVFWRGCSIKGSHVSEVHLRALPILQVQCHATEHQLHRGKESFYPAGETQKLLTFLRAHISEGCQVPHNDQLKLGLTTAPKADELLLLELVGHREARAPIHGRV